MRKRTVTSYKKFCGKIYYSKELDEKKNHTHKTILCENTELKKLNEIIIIIFCEYKIY